MLNVCWICCVGIGIKIFNNITISEVVKLQVLCGTPRK